VEQQWASCELLTAWPVVFRHLYMTASLPV